MATIRPSPARESPARARSMPFAIARARVRVRVSRDARARPRATGRARASGATGMARPRSTRSTLTPTRATPENAPGSSATTDADESAATMATELAAMAMETGTTSLPENFCIIEGRNSVVDFADMQAGEIAQNIESRRQRVFLLMEELRRLRVQQRVKTIGLEDDETVEPREFVSVIPGFPVLTEDSVKDYRIYWGAAVAMLLLFGGLIAPMAEVKLGLGGTSYAEFIDGLHLPAQLAQVDPIVASFTGGAVGAISAFFVIEIENVKEQRKKICMYCKGSGYLQCAECSMSKRPGRLIDPTSGSRCICPTCSGTAKVMCTSCLCTGMALATEHDPRIDPFD